MAAVATRVWQDTLHKDHTIYNTSYLQFLQFFLVVQYSRNSICKKKVNISLTEYHLFFADPNARKQYFQFVLQKKVHIKLIKSKHKEINDNQQLSTVPQIWCRENFTVHYFGDQQLLNIMTRNFWRKCNTKTVDFGQKKLTIKWHKPSTKKHKMGFHSTVFCICNFTTV